MSSQEEKRLYGSAREEAFKRERGRIVEELKAPGVTFSLHDSDDEEMSAEHLQPIAEGFELP